MERVGKGKKGKRGGKRRGKEMERKEKRGGMGKKIFTNIKKRKTEEKEKGKREEKRGERVGKGKRGRKRAPRAPPAWPQEKPQTVVSVPHRPALEQPRNQTSGEQNPPLGIKIPQNLWGSGNRILVSLTPP